MNKSNIFNIIIGILILVLSAMCGVFWNRVNALENQVVNLRIEMADKVCSAKVDTLVNTMVEVKTTLNIFIENHNKGMK